ncbi:hypothetical protein TL16_g07654 [Triparma laevis f. inornata]|uniref:C2H2-type domain-containing protein n=1 Tax=Triparma laevis f. inornata TaxID=1714386 RepID=A0A9W7EEA7_9STRA|nr:hypothetical protein TL16_g07654 [Triparma laevis f. inornata]
MASYDAPPFYTYLPDPLLCPVLAPPGDEAQYNEYQQNFLSGYIRKFFNHHIDDPWFLQSYDPLTSYSFLKSHLDHLDSKTSIDEIRHQSFFVLNDVNSKASPLCVTATLKKLLKSSQTSSTSLPQFEVRLSLRSLTKVQYIILFPAEQEYELFADMLVKETASPRSVIKNNGVGLRVETEDFFCRENGVDEVGGEGRKETVREVWEVRVGGEGNKNIVRVRDSEIYQECVDVLKDMFSERENSENVLKTYRWNVWEGRWAHPGEELVRTYEVHENGVDKTKSLKRGLEKLKELKDLRSQGKILPDDVMELKVQMSEELVTASEKWAESHTVVEGTGDSEKVRGLRNDIDEERVYFFESNTNTTRFARPLTAQFRCRFHFCGKLFKTRDFLTKHLHKKHGKYKEYDLVKEKDEYMKMVREKLRGEGRR